jgi:WD40 repeat protein
MDVQDFTCVSFVDDSSPIYRFDEETNELVATNTNDHSFGRIIAGTAKGDLCVFWQARKSPEIDQILAKDPTVEPAKWWEIPDDYTDEDINQLVLEKISFESTARLVEMVPHDQETGNKFKVSKQVQLEMEGIIKRINMKPDSKVLQERLAEIRYNGPFGHNGAAFQIAYNKKNGLVVSCGADGRLILWKLQMPSPVRVPGVSTQGIFTPLTGSFSEGTHTLLPVDEETKVFHLPTTLPNDDTRPALHAKPTSLFWRDDGKSIVVGSSNHCIWELSIATGKWSLLFEARAGTIISCTSHPSKDEIVTISSDGYLALWDLQEHVCLQRLHFGTNAKANCVQFHPYGDEIAIGMTNGELLIVSYAEFRVMFKKTIRSSSNGSHTDFCITQLKYCTKAMYLAVGSKDTLIHIYDVTNNYKKAHVCEGHASAVVHVTWSANGDILMSNAADGELLFFIISQNKPPKQILDHFHVRDAQWSKWSVLYGWATPGVWGDDTSNLFDIPHVCTTNDSEYSSDEHEDLISVACRNTLRVFRFPCFRGAKYRAYHGHSGNILATCFSYKDNYLVSAGGEDGTIIQWKRKSMGSKKRYLSQHRKTYGDEDIDVVPVAPIPPPSHKNVDGYPSPRQQTRSYKEKSNISSMDESDRNAFILSQCQVLHEFIAENPDELNLCPGEIIRVLSKTNDEWWTGESCDGSKGIFPCSYVEEIQLDENIAEQSSVEPEVELSPPEAAPTRSLVPEPVSEITEIPETVVIPDVELLRPVQSEPKLENHVEINSADSIPDVEPIEHVQSEPRFENHVEISPTDNIPTDIDGSLDFPTEVWSGSAKSDQRYADVDE